MSSKLCEKPSTSINITVEDLYEALDILVKPAEKGSTGDLHDTLEINLENALKKLQIRNWRTLGTLQSVKCPVSISHNIRWRFVCILLHVLLSLKNKFKELGEALYRNSAELPPDLIGANQQLLIRTCLQFVISIGLLPSLLPGVGIALAARCSSSQTMKEEDLVVLEKYERLAGVVRALIACCEQHSLRSVVLSNHLGDVMAALAQLSFVPLKKPVAPQVMGNTVKDGDDFVMTQELWEKMQQERKQFQRCFLSFVAHVYQPLVIRELLLLQGSTEFLSAARSSPPTWLKRVCIQQLIHCMIKQGGVSALIRAICDSAPDIGIHCDKLESIVRLITHVHTMNAEQYYQNICTQILQVLTAKEKGRSQLYVTVCIMCIKALYERKTLMCLRYVLEMLMRPLLLCCNISQNGPVFYREVDLPSGRTQVEDGLVVSEDEMATCLETLHLCIITPGVNSLPLELLSCVIAVLFRLYVKIYKTPCSLKSTVRDLLIGYMVGCRLLSPREVFTTFLFDEKVEDVWTMRSDVDYCLGPTGGVEVRSLAGAGTEVDEAGSCLVALLEGGDRAEDFMGSLFVTLLHFLTQPRPDFEQATNSEDMAAILQQSDRSIAAVKLLAVLAESPAVQASIVRDPSHVIHFLRYMLERDAGLLLRDNSDRALDMESLFLVLVVLSVVINDSSKDRTKWEPFSDLVGPLKVIKQNVSNVELKVFADRLCNAILTHGVVMDCSTVEEETPDKVPAKPLGKMKNKASKKKQRQLSFLEQALCDACNPSIPVAGHAVIQLTNLISSGDQDALNVKQHIFSIFKDSIKHEDSYLYLAGINGLVALAKVMPTMVIKLLLEEFNQVAQAASNQNTVDTKMKVGEALVQIIRDQTDSWHSFNDQLINTFLNGTKDDDFLVRASCLSNLGELCKAMRSRMGPILVELLCCVKAMVQSDPAIEVRRAAVMVITLLLQGLGDDSILVLKSVLLEMYRTLKIVVTTETDEVLKLHVELALEELSRCTKKFLFPMESLEKKIYVLELSNS